MKEPLLILITALVRLSKVQILVKQKNFCLSLQYNNGNSYLFVNGKEIYQSKADNGSVNLPPQFCLGNISNGFSAIESRETSLKGNVYVCLMIYD